MMPRMTNRKSSKLKSNLSDQHSPQWTVTEEMILQVRSSQSKHNQGLSYACDRIEKLQKRGEASIDPRRGKERPLIFTRWAEEPASLLC